MAVPERDIRTAGDALGSGHRGMGVLLMECTKMVPYTRVFSEGLRLPVFSVSIYTFVTWFRSGLVPRDFGHSASAPREWRER